MPPASPRFAEENWRVRPGFGFGEVMTRADSPTALGLETWSVDMPDTGAARTAALRHPQRKFGRRISSPDPALARVINGLKSCLVLSLLSYNSSSFLSSFLAHFLLVLFPHALFLSSCIQKALRVQSTNSTNAQYVVLPCSNPLCCQHSSSNSPRCAAR